MDQRTGSAASATGVLDPAKLHNVSGSVDDYDDLIEAIGDSSIVLIGEASHGTAEFYEQRAAITNRLIEERGFNAVAIEGDWPDADRVDRYVRGDPETNGDLTGMQALAGFQRFPSWMWRNHVMLAWVDWLRFRNSTRSNQLDRVGVYGLDLYSMRSSMAAVVEYLDKVDPQAAVAAKHRYACFDQVGISDPEHLGQEYGYAVTSGSLDPCEDAVVAELVDLNNRRLELVSRDGYVAQDDYFAAIQNAALVHDAELYYRAMYHGRASSWNLRDSHMVQTLAALREHLSQRVPCPKVVVWAHNSHVGDARATELSRPDRQGGEPQHNVGQLVRTRWPGESFVIGLTTSHGTVTAATDWGGPTLRRTVRPARSGSFEKVFHDCGVPVFYALTNEESVEADAVLLERAIGVIYRPESERASHWFAANMATQFDAVLHIDKTTALTPLDHTSRWDRGEPPETYPTGL